MIGGNKSIEIDDTVRLHFRKIISSHFIRGNGKLDSRRRFPCVLRAHLTLNTTRLILYLICPPRNS